MIRALTWLAGVVVVLVIVGALIPRVMFSDGLSELQGETRLAGEAALKAAWLMGCDEPFAPLWMRQLRVVHVERAPGQCPAPFTHIGSGYRVLIQRYSFFGIRVGMISVCGDAGECWRGRVWG